MYLQRSNVYNEEVKKIQNMLNNALLQPQYRGKWQHIVPDGYYGPLTETAVKAFQVNHNPRIDQTGIVGDTTYAALQNVGPSISTAPPYSIIDDIRTRTYLAREFVYTTFRDKYENYFGSFVEPFLDECRVSTKKFMNNMTYNKLAKTQLFKDLAKICTRVLRIDKIVGNNDIILLRKEINDIERSNINRKSTKISKRTIKIEKLINNIKKTTIIHPHELASRATKFITKGTGGVIQWTSVILDVCELVNYLMKPHAEDESHQKLYHMLGKIIDDAILVLIGVATGLGLAALGASSWPIWVAIIASVVVAFIVDSVYRFLCEKAGGDNMKPLSLSVSEKIVEWVNSSECEAMLESREMYIYSAPPRCYIQSAPPRMYFENSKR